MLPSYRFRASSQACISPCFRRSFANGKRTEPIFDFQKLLGTLPQMIWKFLGCLLIATVLPLNATTPKTANGHNEKIQAIAPATHPLPSESESWEFTQFSFIVYGDTRGRRDGKAPPRFPIVVCGHGDPLPACSPSNESIASCERGWLAAASM